MKTFKEWSLMNEDKAYSFADFKVGDHFSFTDRDDNDKYIIKKATVIDKVSNRTEDFLKAKTEDGEILNVPFEKIHRKL